MKVKTLSASETAYFLRAKLGDVRAWDDLLADMRRGRAGYHGEVLLPVGKYSATRPLARFIYLVKYVSSSKKPHDFVLPRQAAHAVYA